MNPDQQREALILRDRHLTPKQIARKLGVKPAEVSRWLQNQAEHAASERRERGELAPLVACTVDATTLDILYRKTADDRSPSAGLSTVCVVRQQRGSRLSAWVYLVDYFCLGLKNMFGPRSVSESELQPFLRDCYRGYGSFYEAIAIEQAREIVYGAIDYARQFDFEPSSEFAATAGEALGDWDGRCSLEFGKDGQPLYLSGPYDNAAAILQKLNRNPGPGNYHYVAAI